MLGHPHRLGCADEVALDHRLCGATRDPRHPGCGGQGDREDGHPVLRPDEGDRDQRQHDLWERHDHVHAPHQDVVDPVPRVRRHQADGEAGNQTDRRRDDGQDQDDEAAVQEPAPDVLSEVVSAEERPAAPPGERLADELVRSMRRDEGSEDREHHQDPHEDEADPRATESEGTADEVRAASRRGRGVDSLGHGQGLVGVQLEVAHSRVLSRGVTRIVATSASRLSSTYKPAIRIASAWTTGMSWFTTASTSWLPMPG